MPVMTSSKKAPTLRNSQLISFNSRNYELLYLNSDYLIIPMENGIGLKSHVSDLKYMIPVSCTSLLPVFELLLHGLSYENLLSALPAEIENREEFVADLWQRGILL